MKNDEIMFCRYTGFTGLIEERENRKNEPKQLYLFCLTIRSKRINNRKGGSPLHSAVPGLTALSSRPMITKLPPPPLRKPSAGRNAQTASKMSPTRPVRCAPAIVAHIAINAKEPALHPHSHL